MKILLLASTLALLSGCAFQRQVVNLQPTVTVAGSDIGTGVSVAVKVVDERPTKSIGHRGTAYGKAAEIASDQDLAAVVAEQLRIGLEKKGFAAGDYSQNSPTRLAVEIRLLDYSTSTGFWSGGVHLKAALKVDAKNGGKDFDKMYRKEREQRVQVVPTAGTNEQWLNEALGDVITQVLADEELLSFLAGKN